MKNIDNDFDSETDCLFKAFRLQKEKIYSYKISIEQMENLLLLRNDISLKEELLSLIKETKKNQAYLDRMLGRIIAEVELIQSACKKEKEIH